MTVSRTTVHKEHGYPYPHNATAIPVPVLRPQPPDVQLLRRHTAHTAVTPDEFVASHIRHHQLQASLEKLHVMIR